MSASDSALHRTSLTFLLDAARELRDRARVATTLQTPPLQAQDKAPPYVDALQERLWDEAWVQECKTIAEILGNAAFQIEEAAKRRNSPTKDLLDHWSR
jgi:hypothetical protein